MRHLFQKATYILLALCCLALLAACGSGSSGQKQQAKTPAPTPTVIVSQGQQLLAQSAQLLDSARTLHGIFDTTISGQLINGELDSEIWRAGQEKSRTLALKSTLSQFASGTLVVDNGKQIWQYNPAQKIVYTGPASSTSTGTPSLSQGNAQQLIFSDIQMIFTHSTAMLLSSTSTLNGQPIYILQVSPQTGSGSSTTVSLNYTGTVSIDQQTRLPVAMDLTLSGFGQARIAIPSLALNQPLAASLFTFTPPPGTKVLPFPTTSTSGQTGGSLTLAQAEQQAGYHLLSIPAAQNAYHLQSIDALGAPGNQIYALNYTFNGQSFTLSEGKALANLPLGSSSLPLRGTTATLSTSGGTSTLSWTEKGVGIQLSGPLSKGQLVAIANLLA